MSAGRTYHASVLVLKKTKLGESDLILSMLAGDGSLVKAVAKGARKPTSSFATRLDLFCESEVMLARGRNLDIASEVRLLNRHDPLRSNAAALFAAAPVLDLLAQTTLPDLPVANLYPMATSALGHMDVAPEELLPAFTAAFALKLLAFLGVRPQVDSCVLCGAPFDAHTSGSAYVSFSDGGYVCDGCAATSDRIQVHGAMLQWAHLLLRSTFDEIAISGIPAEASFDVLHFLHAWLRETQEINSKAMNQLLSCGLF